MDRRSFLRRGLFGGVVLALGAGGLALSPGRRFGTPTRALRVLDEERFQVMAAIAARVVRAPGADPLEIAHGVDEALARAVPEVQSDLRNLLGLFENALPGLLFDGRFSPFTRLSEEVQDRALQSWRDSRLVVRRSGYHALRRLCLGVYYGDPVAWPSIHYGGPPDLGGFMHDDSKVGTAAWIAEQEAAAQAAASAKDAPGAPGAPNAKDGGP